MILHFFSTSSLEIADLSTSSVLACKDDMQKNENNKIGLHALVFLLRMFRMRYRHVKTCNDYFLY